MDAIIGLFFLFLLFGGFGWLLKLFQGGASAAVNTAKGRGTFKENFEVVEGSYKEFELLYYSFFKAYLKILKQYSLIFKSEQIVKSCSKSNTKINRSYSIQRKFLTENEYKDYYIQNYLKNNNLIYYYSDLLSFIS